MGAKTQYLCDECGREIEAVGILEAMVTVTGRVLIDGVDNNLQSAILCGDHYPIMSTWNNQDVTTWQPRNCKRVHFFWPGVALPGPEDGDVFDAADAEAAAAEMEIEDNWQDNWVRLVMPNGELNLDQLKRELFDYSLILQEVSQAYDAITGGRISKPITDHRRVIEAVDRHYGAGKDSDESRPVRCKVTIRIDYDNPNGLNVDDIAGQAKAAVTSVLE